MSAGCRSESSTLPRPSRCDGGLMVMCQRRPTTTEVVRLAYSYNNPFAIHLCDEHAWPVKPAAKAPVEDDDVMRWFPGTEPVAF